MTAKELFNKTVTELSFSDEAEFEAYCLFESLLNISKTQLIINTVEISNEQISIIEDAVLRRKKSEPLQYIIGNWDFYDMSFIVGEGVLIPRPETEALVEFALEKIKNIENPIIYDLCAGSGCIGLTISKHRIDAKVYLLEKEANAIKYLEKNKEKYNLKNAFVIQGDMFNFDFSNLPDADIILSNPPYIPVKEINDLQKEVLFEPITALNGGDDGLDFYRCLAEKWILKVKKGGYVAIECGDGQSEDIISLFDKKYSEKRVIYDFNNIDRIVIFGI